MLSWCDVEGEDVGMSRISYDLLITYAAGELYGPEASAVEAWLAVNAAAAETVFRYRMVDESVRLDDGTEPPSQAAARARALFSRPGRPTLAVQVGRLVARLIFDSRTQPVLAGLRGRGTSFHLTYDLSAAGAGDSAELDLQAEPSTVSGRTWRVVGQVAGRAGP